MRAYVIRRILLVIPTLFIVTVLVFLSVRFIPGDIIDVMTARMTATQSGTIDEEALKRQLGLDKPVYAQYAKWIGDIVLRGTLGRSLYSGSLGSATVEQKLAGRVGVTVELGLLAILTGVIIAVPIGIYSAIRQYTVADYAGRAVAIFGLATPNFWLGLMVMIYPAIWWGWTPPLTHVRFTEDPWANLGMLIIPAVILGTYLAASTMRMTRTMMLEVLRQDYVRTAWAKGVGEGRVVLRHAVKNALIPVVTLVALQLPIIAGGSVIIENIFNLPGLGSLMLSALNARDYPVVSGVNLLFASVVVVINLGTDLTYALLDPRVRYE